MRRLFHISSVRHDRPVVSSLYEKVIPVSVKHIMKWLSFFSIWEGDSKEELENFDDIFGFFSTWEGYSRVEWAFTGLLQFLLYMRRLFWIICPAYFFAFVSSLYEKVIPDLEDFENIFKVSSLYEKVIPTKMSILQFLQRFFSYREGDSKNANGSGKPVCISSYIEKVLYFRLRKM